MSYESPSGTRSFRFSDEAYRDEASGDKRTSARNPGSSAIQASGILPTEDPPSPVHTAPAMWEGLIIRTGIVIFMMLTGIPMWNAILLLEDTNFVFWVGGSAPSFLIAFLLILMAVYVFSINAFFKYTYLSHRTEQTMAMMATAFVSLFGLLLVVTSLPLAQQVGETTNNLLYRCAFSEQTRAVFAEWKLLYDIRQRPACLGEESVETCSDYKATENSQHLKYMEDSFQCSGFCYSGSTLLLANENSVEGAIHVHLQLLGEQQRVACIAVRAGASFNTFQLITSNENSVRVVDQDVQLALTKDSDGNKILPGTYLVRCASEDNTARVLSVVVPGTTVPDFAIADAGSLTGVIKLSMTSSLNATIACVAAGAAMPDFQTIDGNAHKVTVVGNGNVFLPDITAEVTGAVISNGRYVVSCASSNSPVFTHDILVGPLSVNARSTNSQILVSITSVGIDGANISCVSVKNATHPTAAAIHADDTKVSAQIAANAATMPPIVTDTNAVGINPGWYTVHCADTQHVASVEIVVASTLLLHKKHRNFHAHHQHSVLNLGMASLTSPSAGNHPLALFSRKNRTVRCEGVAAHELQYSAGDIGMQGLSQGVYMIVMAVGLMFLKLGTSMMKRD